MTSAIEELNERRQSPGNLWDNFGNYPLSDFHLKSLLADNRINISEVLVTHRKEMEVVKENNIIIVDSDGNPTPEEKLDVRGVLVKAPDGVWLGGYYHLELRAWIQTFEGDNKRLVGQMHDLYVLGYERGIECANVPDDAIKPNPTETLHDLYG